MKNKKYVSASEIGDFVYCKRGWWLRFNGLLSTTKTMLAGTAAHEKLSTTLHTNRRNINIAWIIIICGIILLLVAFLVLVK
jgi:CRISPR/Cas system-associated exonuclease Cas4 (RecB family)